MNANCDLDPIDFFPGCDPFYYAHVNRRRKSKCAGVSSHLITIAVTAIMCLTFYYYYEKPIKEKLNVDEVFNTIIKNEDDNKYLEDLRKELEVLRQNVTNTQIWRNHLDELYHKIYTTQESLFNDKIKKALDVYHSDQIGLFDYASTYACGAIVSTPDTVPYPANKTLSFFSLVTVDLLSNAEVLIQPGVLPGNCFAFYGESGRIRIKLGKKIKVAAVTMDHATLMEDPSSAPKDFEVYGLDKADSISGVLLGKFTYDLTGRPYQTFDIDDDRTQSKFEYVELYILNNHGRSELTCVYRFRVHDKKLKDGFTGFDGKVCLNCNKKDV